MIRWQLFYLGFAVLIAPLTVITAVYADDENHPPNIILIMADDMGWGDPGFNGGTTARTPCLDAMAEAGMTFNRFYAAAPVCSPTRGSCLTGRHPYRYSIFTANSGHILPEEILLSEILREQGYATGHFGKWHLGTLTTEVIESNRGGPRGAAHFSPPWENGFDTCFSTEAKVPTWDPLLRPAGNNSNAWWNPVDDPADAVAYGTNYWVNGELVTDDLRGDDSRAITDAAIDFIRDGAKSDQPFFAVVWFHAPHLPVVSGEEYTKPFAELDPHSQHYFGCISALDEQVGRLREELRDLDAAEKTIVWFCSDNGPEGRANSSPGSAGPLRGRKRDLWEGGVRVPGIWEWPARITAGSTTDTPASTSDYLPTILEILGVEYPDDRPVDGISLSTLIGNSEWPRPTGIGFESGRQTAWIEDRYKLLRRTTDEFMLFDITNDPGESHDLAAEHPELVEQMAERLARWRASCDDSRKGADYD